MNELSISEKDFTKSGTVSRCRLEEKEGWTPAMFLREIASSQHNAREKGKHAAVRAMLRDTRLNSISVIAGEKIQQYEFANKFKQNVVWSVSVISDYGLHELHAYREIILIVVVP